MSPVDVSLSLSLEVNGGIASGEDYRKAAAAATWQEGGEEERAGPTPTCENREGSPGCKVPPEGRGSQPGWVPVSGREVPSLPAVKPNRDEG